MTTGGSDLPAATVLDGVIKGGGSNFRLAEPMFFIQLFRRVAPIPSPIDVLPLEEMIGTFEFKRWRFWMTCWKIGCFGSEKWYQISVEHLIKDFSSIFKHTHSLFETSVFEKFRIKQLARKTGILILLPTDIFKRDINEFSRNIRCNRWTTRWFLFP